MAFARLLVLTLLVLGLGANANAGVQMYSAEVIVHMRGADTADNFVGVPLGLNCNTRTYHPQITPMFTYPSGTFTLTLPAFGGNAPCSTAALKAGAPLTGGGSLATTGTTTSARSTANPRGFTIPASNVSRVTSGGSFPQFSTWLPLPVANAPFVFSIEYASLKNAAGGFAKSDGPGSFTVARNGAKASVTAGKNQFGGTMRMLGHYRANRGITYGTLSVGATPWNLQYMGVGADTMGGVVTAGRMYYTMITRSYRYIGKFGYSPRTATFEAFPWTTGTAEVTATGGVDATMLKRTGYDNRTPAGAGTIQMVSPALARWQNPWGDFYTASIATMKLRFVPEPASASMLAAGVIALAYLYRANHRRDRA